MKIQLCPRRHEEALGLISAVIVGVIIVATGVLVYFALEELTKLKPRELPPDDPNAGDTSWMDHLPAQFALNAPVFNTNVIVDVYGFGFIPPDPTNADGSTPAVFEKIMLGPTRIEQSGNLSNWGALVTFHFTGPRSFTNEDVTIEWRADNSGVDITPSAQALKQSSLFWRAVAE